MEMLPICADYLIDHLNATRQKVLRYAEDLITIDSRTEDVIQPLFKYCGGFSLENLNKPCYKTCDSTQKLILNKKYIIRLTETVPLIHILDAVTLFTFHEVYHISQGFKYFDDVSKLKAIVGTSKMGHFDLQSAFIAAHTVSLIRMLEQAQIYSTAIYIQNFYKFWCQIGGGLLNLFPASQNKVKQKRFFGFLLMAYLTHNAYWHKHSLEFNSELWPEWTDSLDQLVVFGKYGNIWLRPSVVDSQLMEKILSAITTGSYSTALYFTGELFSNLPRN